VAPSFPTDRGELAPLFGLYAFNESPSILDGLPVDIVQLTNNHANDLGPEGITETEQEVDARGFLGVGLDGEALLVERGGQTFAFLAYTWGLNRYEPPPGRDLGIVPFGHLDEEIELERVVREARRARADGATHVVVLVHWGYEYEFYPAASLLVLGRRLVESGADLVVGTGPHVVQPAEWCHVNQPAILPGIGTCSVRTPDGRRRDAAILYSLGDFVTELPGTELATGILATVSFTEDAGVSGLAWDPIVSIHDQPVTRAVPLETLVSDPVYAAEDARLRAHLGPGWRASLP
jgi:poly-gamma-glutamate capsule biosynthesis protein CapA/YwtB (metallophosphatase superfamily)